MTSVQLNHLAKEIQGCWQQFALTLEPVGLFKVRGNIAAIKSEHASPLVQAQAMLENWSDNVGARACRSILIQALIKQGLRSQANEVFGEEIVLQVSPQ